MFAINSLVFVGFFAALSVKTHAYYNITGSFNSSYYTEEFESVVLEPDQQLKDDPKIVSMKVIAGVGENVTKINANFIANLPNLVRFDLSECFVEEVEPGAFKNVPLLVMLGLSCELKEIKEGVFNNLPIKHLFLKGNKIKSIATKAFDDMPNLSRINLSHNKMTHWDVNWFQNTPELKYVVFDENLLVELPDEAFRNIQKDSAIIWMRANRIQHLGNRLFSGNRNVHLLLGKNEIDYFSEHVLDGVETMRMLNLADNRLKCVSGNFSRIFVAQKIYLEGNSFDEECKKNITKWATEQEDKGNVKHITFKPLRD